jgi:lysozyme
MATRLQKTGAAVTITAAGLLAIATIGHFEGLRLVAYRDVIGVWTVCYGETKGIHGGLKFTKDQCDVMFIGSLTEHEAGMRKCLNNPDIIPEKSYVAFLSLAYNIGSGGFCKSSVAREINAGHLVKACQNLLRFNKAGGRVVGGLVTRRNVELKLCLQGVRDGTISSPQPTVEPIAVEPTLQVAPTAPEPVPAPVRQPPAPKPQAQPKPAPKPYSYDWWKGKIQW